MRKIKSRSTDNVCIA